MSLNILQDHNLNIEIALHKKIRTFQNGKIVEFLDPGIPLELNSILSLNIEDSLLATGLRGTIEIDNKFKSFDVIDLSAKSGEELFIDIVIEDTSLLDLNGIKKHDTKVEFLGLVEKTQTASANIEDNIVIFEFEEAFVAEMKHTAWADVSKLMAFSAGAFGDNKYNVIDIVNSFHDHAFTGGTTDRITLLDNGELPEESAVAVGQLGSMQTLESATDIPDEKVYSVFQRFLKRTSAADDTATLHLPSFRMANTPDGRRMVFKKYLSNKHRQFIDVALKGSFSEEKERNFADVFTEKFTGGIFATLDNIADVNTSWHNKLETFNITRPDVGYLRENVWGNYYFPGGRAEDYNNDPTKMANDIVYYAEIANLFTQVELGLKPTELGGVNLPLIDASTQAKFVRYPIQNSDKGIDLAKIEAYNTVAKSFITVNEQIQFESKGQLYRKPGKFIWVELDNSKASPTSLERLWYVNSVVHKIQDGVYTTEITANRVFGENGPDAFEALLKEARKKLDPQKTVLSSNTQQAVSVEPSFRSPGEDTPTLKESFETEDSVPNRIPGTDSSFRPLPDGPITGPRLSDDPAENKILELAGKAAPPPITPPSAILPTVPTIEDVENSKKRKEYEELLEKELTSPDFGPKDLRRMQQLRFELGIKVETVTPFN